VPEHADASDDEHRNRRRGRRGGRRRRIDGDIEVPPHAEPGAEQPELPPAYAGPTPANPFGGPAFDIFDVLESAEASPVPPVEVAPVVPEPEPTPPSPVILDEPEPERAEAMDAEPASVETSASAEQVTSGPTQQPLFDAAPEPEPVPANDAAPEPLVKPIIIGRDEDAVVEKKRGWWRR